MGHLDDIQSALKPLKKLEKIEIHFMIILGLAELLKTMNQPGPAVTFFDGLFFRNYKRWGREILTQSSFKSSICVIKI